MRWLGRAPLYYDQPHGAQCDARLASRDPMRRSAAGRRESALERWCVNWARAHHVTTSKLTDPTGIPDHVFWALGGVPWIIEFKAPGELPSPLQWYYLVALHADGYRTAVVTTKEGFLRLMNEWQRR